MGALLSLTVHAISLFGTTTTLGIPVAVLVLISFLFASTSLLIHFDSSSLFEPKPLGIGLPLSRAPTWLRLGVLSLGLYAVAWFAFLAYSTRFGELPLLAEFRLASAFGLFLCTHTTALAYGEAIHRVRLKRGASNNPTTAKAVQPETSR